MAEKEIILKRETSGVERRTKPVLLTTPFNTIRTPELKTIREWCVTCCFEEITTKGKKYWKVRNENIPKSSDCLDCIYSKVADIKVTKPKNWRKVYKNKREQ